MVSIKVVYADLIAKVTKALGRVIMNNHNGVSFISGLLGIGGPSNISRLVIPINIYSVNGMIIAWWISNVVGKILKRLKPSIAYFNSSSAIIFPSWISRIGATLNHIFPSHVKSRSGSSVCFICSRRKLGLD